ncbi:ATP-binding protein [Euzebya sp.]|uniref:ATP-binding protein n=1 Tax=Euzebya sp. TaxID=1971409 RepID=UPI0035145947
MTPARRLEANRVWAWDGSVWAVWRVGLPTYPFASTDDKLALHARVREALVALPADAQLISTCVPVPAEELARRVSAGVPARAAERWRRAASADLAALVGYGCVERRLYVAARIVPPRAGTVLAAAVESVARRFGAGGPRPARADGRVAVQATRDLGQRLERVLHVTPVAPPEIAWLYRRAVLRGIADPPPPAGHTTPVGTPPDDAVLWEGGRGDDPDRPRHRRYLRIDTERGTGYQATAVVSEMPSAFQHPGGGEWFTVADLAPFGVDWVARIHAVGNAEAQLRARRQQRQLTAQYAEYEGEPAGPPRSLAAALDGVDDEQAALAANPGDPELQVTIAFSVTGRTPAEVDARAAQLGDLLQPWGYAVHRPTGGQVALHTAALPGAAAPPVCDDYTQHLLPRDLAAGAPVAGSAVGDPRGIPIGVDAHSGQARAVLIDPAHGPATNRSGSLGVFGALGSGKSYFVKRLALGTVARGGRVVTLDRTASGEYVRLAGAMAADAGADTCVVDLDEPGDVGLDPLRVFAGEDGIRVALGFLTLLTRTTPSDVDGAVLAAAVRRVAAGGGRLVDVLAALESTADPEAVGLRRKLAVHADQPLAQLVFGDRPPLRLDADYICFHAAGLSLPDRDAVVHEHLARQVLPEQLFAQALLYLVAAVARALTFADPRTFGATLVDEAWALTASPQGRQLLLDSIRDGRKHNAAVWLLSQHPDDLGDDALSHLLGMRALFRQSRGAAPAALRFMGLDATDDLVGLLSAELQTGQCLFRDVADRIGVVQVLPAASSDVRAALDTTPEAAA